MTKFIIVRRVDGFGLTWANRFVADVTKARTFEFYTTAVAVALQEVALSPDDWEIVPKGRRDQPESAA